MADDELLITIDTDENPEGVAVGTGADPVDDLKRQYAEAQTRAEDERKERVKAQNKEREARAEAARAREEATAARSQAADSELGTVAAGLQQADSEAAAAEQAYAAASAEGNFVEAAKQQRRMARAEAERVRLDEAKADLEARKIRPTERETYRTEPAATRETRATGDGDPVESFLGKCSPQTAAWLRLHPEHARAIAMNAAGGATVEESRRANRMNAAHADALSEGYNADTPEYFSHVEQYLANKEGATNGSGNGAAKPAVQTQTRRSTVPVAPVRATGGGTSGSDSRTVRLTPGQAKRATDGTLIWNYDDPSGQKRFKKGDPIGHQEFARRMLAMKKEGTWDRGEAE